MILCGSVVAQLDNLAAYNMVKLFEVSQTEYEEVIEVIETINSSDQHEGHDDVEIHTKFPSTLTGMNVTIDTDGRSADITSGDVLTSPDDQDIDTSLKKVVSSDVNKLKAE